MPVLSINGTELFHFPVGSGIPCLVMHGGLGFDHTLLHPWLDPLSDRLQLVYYDHRGHGRSGRPDPASITFEALCADADALRTHLGHRKVAVIGHSYGGLLAIDYALHYPERVSHLILVDSTPRLDFGDAVMSAQRRGGSAEQIAAFSKAATCSDEELGKLFEILLPLYFQTYRGDEFQRLAAKILWSASGFRRGAELSTGLDLTPRLGEVSAPTLIIVGDDDFITPVASSEILHRGIPGAELQVIPRSGHFPYFEQPAEFFLVARDWVARRGPSDNYAR